MIPNRFPDGSRRRRQGDNTKARWYAIYRSLRWCDHFGLISTLLDELTRHELETRAYYFWLNSGGGDGHDLNDWLQAIEEENRNRPVEIHRAISIDKGTISRLLNQG